MMRAGLIAAGLGLLGAIGAYAEPVEVLTEGGISVSFEKTGDESQIRAFKQSILPEVKSILQELASELGGEAKTNAKLYFYSPETFGKK